MKKCLLISIALLVLQTTKAQLVSADNGLTAVSNTVGLGGTLNQNTTVDVGSIYTFGIKKSSNSYLNVLNNGNIGIGTGSPAYKLDVTVPSGSSGNTVVNLNTMDFTYSADRLYQAVAIPPSIGINNSYGISWHNDGGVVGTALVSDQKIAAFAYASTNEKFFRVMAADNNLSNFSLDRRPQRR